MFSPIKNLFGGKKAPDQTSTATKAKKGKDFFLEIEETENVASEATAPKPEPAKEAVATTEPPKAEELPKAEPASKEELPKAEPAPKKAKKKKSVKAAAASTDQKKVSSPAASTAAKNGKVEPQAQLTFAPNYLLPTPSNRRRRPGPSMNMFLDMARQAKTKK